MWLPNALPNAPLCLRAKTSTLAKRSHRESDTSHSSDSQEHSYPNEGKLLMIRRLLNNQPSIPLNDQRENIFHTRCEVLKNTCFFIINSGSCCNCYSTRLVEKLNLTLLPHPKP